MEACCHNNLPTFILNFQSHIYVLPTFILVALHELPRPLKIQNHQQGQVARTMDMASRLLYTAGLQAMLAL